MFQYPVHDSLVNTRSIVRVTKIAENILTITPIPRVRANPLTKLDVRYQRIMAVMMVVTFESLIEGQARRKPSSMAETLLNPFFNSSLVLSKIRILASTAIPIERTKPATPAKVIVKLGIILKTARVRRV